ncbi:hypothetical protein F0342_21475 [Bacillus sp. CH30_1T]|uniref:hypothetical protein n=1 Tax=Bacillus sp. CH30_1T TaxID=2604836 RepID=UPI0011F0516F|nr:hypothetical protein [Bacillus sp. CH30_1T]KAA0560735.1 hypothetical protein F0342_21475 [Bacillus sp. CH30_1T]
MNRVIDYFKEEIANKVEIIKMDDNFQSFTLSLNLLLLKREFDFDDIYFIEEYINKRDSISLNITIDGGDPFNLPLNNADKVNEVLLSINELTFDDDEVIVNVKYEVKKNNYNNTISIYDLNSFTSYINKLKLEHLLNVMNEFLDPNHCTNLEIQNSLDKLVLFKSDLLLVATQNAGDEIEINDYPNSSFRMQTIKNRLANTSPQTLAKYKFLPDDFHNEISTASILGDVFAKLKILLSISFIANSSEITNHDHISFNLFGHKFIKFGGDFSELAISDVHSFFDIYEWIYLERDPHDKLELARNIIGRYFKTMNGNWHLAVDCINAIQSAHAIYLKENVEKYIETKNKVAEVVTEISVKSKEVNQFFISSFKNNNLTLLTYFISLFIFNSLSSNPDSKIFNTEKFIITIGFLFISSIYLTITLKQYKNEIDSNEDYFFSMKKIYEDIFEPRELNNLFSHTHLLDSKNFIRTTVKRYTRLWIIEIMVLLLISTILTFFIKI